VDGRAIRARYDDSIAYGIGTFREGSNRHVDYYYRPVQGCGSVPELWLNRHLSALGYKRTRRLTRLGLVLVQG
jgi:hypothetical protein